MLALGLDILPFRASFQSAEGGWRGMARIGAKQRLASAERLHVRKGDHSMGTPRRGFMLALFIVLVCGGLPSPAWSQTPSSAPSPAQLEKLVAPIALYPDPLVAQILPASTHPL